MVLPLKESRAARELAEMLYDFLPGSGSAAWKGHVSFRSVANQVGVGEFWQAGSKQPMIATLLERTLAFRRGRFESLILEIVRSGLTYRQKNGRPVRSDEVDRINGLLLEIGFKFPDLWDPDFLASLRADGARRGAERVEQVRAAERLCETERSQRREALENLRDQLVALHTDPDRQSAGLKLERVLNDLFKLHDLSPREPFRVRGEQIDGSFEWELHRMLPKSLGAQTLMPTNAAESFMAQITRGPGYVEPPPISGRTALRLAALLRQLQPERYGPLPATAPETPHTASPHHAQSPAAGEADRTEV